MTALLKPLLWLIPIVMLVLLALGFFRSGGLLDRAGSLSNESELGKYIPDVEIGAEEVEGVTVTIPENHVVALEELASTINAVANSGIQYCFDNYRLSSLASDYSQGLPALGDEGTQVRLSENSMFVYASGGRQIMTRLSQEFTSIAGEFQPCVIAGSRDVVTSFGTFFLNTNAKSSFTPPETPPHYQLVESITIKGDGSENKIEFTVGGKSFKEDLEDYGMLYSPSRGLVCFFPTVDGNTFCDGSSEHGLDDDCLGEDIKENINLYNQLQNVLLKRCA